MIPWMRKSIIHIFLNILARQCPEVLSESNRAIMTTTEFGSFPSPNARFFFFSGANTILPRTALATVDAARYGHQGMPLLPISHFKQVTDDPHRRRTVRSRLAGGKQSLTSLLCQCAGLTTGRHLR